MPIRIDSDDDFECPYCRVGLIRKPASKRPCPACGKAIFFRQEAGRIFGSKLLTAVQVAHFDEYRRMPLKKYISWEMVAAHRSRLIERTGAEPAPVEVLREVRKGLPPTDAQRKFAKILGRRLAMGTSMEDAIGIIGRAVSERDAQREAVRQSNQGYSEADEIDDAVRAIRAVPSDNLLDAARIIEEAIKRSTQGGS